MGLGESQEVPGGSNPSLNIPGVWGMLFPKEYPIGELEMGLELLDVGIWSWEDEEQEKPIIPHG